MRGRPLTPNMLNGVGALRAYFARTSHYARTLEALQGGALVGKSWQNCRDGCGGVLPLSVARSLARRGLLKISADDPGFYHIRRKDFRPDVVSRLGDVLGDNGG